MELRVFEKNHCHWIVCHVFNLSNVSNKRTYDVWMACFTVIVHYGSIIVGGCELKRIHAGMTLRW